MVQQFLKVFICLLVTCASASASAQAWPTAKPIRIEIAFGPGSASDIFARIIADPLSKALGQTVIVESTLG